MANSSITESAALQIAAYSLFHNADLSYREISSLTNAPMGTVKSRISRGRKRIKDLGKLSGEIDPDFQDQRGGRKRAPRWQLFQDTISKMSPGDYQRFRIDVSDLEYANAQLSRTDKGVFQRRFDSEEGIYHVWQVKPEPTEADKKKVRRQVRMLRGYLEETQAEFACRFNRTPAVISTWETGRIYPRAEQRQAISDLLQKHVYSSDD